MRPNQKGVVLCRAGRNRGKWGTRAWVYWRGLYKGEDGNLKSPHPLPTLWPRHPLNFPLPKIDGLKFTLSTFFSTLTLLNHFKTTPSLSLNVVLEPTRGRQTLGPPPMHNPLQQELSVIKCICYAYLLWLLIIYKEHLNQARNFSWN